MKTVTIKSLLAIMGITAGMVACGSDEMKSTEGVVIEASMNTLMVVTQSGDSLFFDTVNADKSQVNGLLLGDTVQVFYVRELKSGVSQENVATKLIVRPRVNALFGAWVEPVPGQEGGAMQGFDIARNGDASSINMATLVYESWSQTGDSLTLEGKSIGNGQTIDFTQAAKIEKLDADSLVLSSDRIVRRFVRGR